MKRIVTLLAIAAACSQAHAWGPGDSGGGEPPGPNATFEQGLQRQCLMPGDMWDEFFPMLACGYVPPLKPPTGWKPPPIVVPTPPVPEPATWLTMLAGLCALGVVLWILRLNVRAELRPAAREE